MLGRLAKIEKRYQELGEQMAAPEVTSDVKKLQVLAQERAGVEDLVKKYREYKATAKSLEETRVMLDDEKDEEMAKLVRQEIENLEAEKEELTGRLRAGLLPKDPNDEKDIIMEIRAGTGGEEAALFAADLFRLYSRYAQDRNWKTDVISMNESGIGGLKEIIFEIK